MKSGFLLAAVAAFALSGWAGAQSYFPPAGAEHWERVSPQEAGFDPQALQEAIDFAVERETRNEAPLGDVVAARELTIMVPLQWAAEPYSDPIGPLADRGDPSGVIVRGGRIVAEWGEPERVDMAFSVTKSFLSHVVGLAIEDGLIGDVHMPVSAQVRDERFHTAHNAPVTWDQLLRQTSGWWGELWGKLAWADRPGTNPHDALVAGPPVPGSAYEYNDVRVNALALAATHLFARELPDVLRERIMDPIGASDGWVWHGYHNSYAEVDGERLLSVSGGGHWGGGMFIDAYDMARFGLLGLHRGEWDGERLLSDAFFGAALAPGEHNAGYGYMNFFLNAPDTRMYSEALPGNAYFHLGAGTNLVFVSPNHDLVAVVRWIEGAAMRGFLERLIAAIEEPATEQ
ncbi:MAG: serine hydrolase [Oceanicaulis sp.]|uniref:serine hydrolase domain-containing protein n=1 Tax=Glycocaulis sp. TaxID=1969725 RepID=UPI0025C4C577|nr:serine hydrolase [Glycocaulis sp.]MCC5981544.1 serine hydrolase [Oceanicaulis sp.]MCH8521267.1 beta-lactamase family protein [Glycocaulis sp.]